MNNFVQLLLPRFDEDADITSIPNLHDLSKAFNRLVVENTGDDPDDPSFFREYLFEIIMSLLLTIQISFLIVGSCYRYDHYKDVGLYSL